MKMGTVIKHVRFTDNYKEQLTEFIDDYFDTLKLIEFDERNALVDSLIEKYVEDTGVRPDGVALDRLAHVLAWDYMEGDTNIHKVAHEEYPILTEHQIQSRTTGLSRKKNSYGVSFYEVPIENAEYVATNGKDYRLPIRRYR